MKWSLELELTRFRGHMVLCVLEAAIFQVSPLYLAEFRQQMVGLVRAGRTPAELSRECNVDA